MNPEIQQHLISYLDKLEVLAKQGADFAADQIPLVLQEYIVYSRVVSTAHLSVGILAFLLGIVFCAMAIREKSWASGSEFPVGAAYLIFSCILVVFVGPMNTIDHGDRCIKAWTAPRVLLIEKLN